MQHIRLAATGLLLGTLAATPLAAAPVLDQKNEAPPFVQLLVQYPSIKLAQQVLPGLEGLLTAFSLDVLTRPGIEQGEILFSIRSSLNGPNLAQVVYANSIANSGFLTFDVSAAGIFTTIGDDLFIVAEGAPGANGALIPSRNPTDYVGTMYFQASSFPGEWRVDSTFYDLRFRTFVDTSIQPGGPDPDPVPEPATLALFGAGLFGLSLAARRRRASR